MLDLGLTVFEPFGEATQSLGLDFGHFRIEFFTRKKKSSIERKRQNHEKGKEKFGVLTKITE